MSLTDSKQTKPQILSTQIVTRSRLFCVERVNLRFSNGEQRQYERLKGGNRAAVMVLPIDGEDLLMIREYAVGSEKYELGFVKGAVELDESVEQGANRELQEEIGFAAREFFHLRSLYSSPGYSQNLLHVVVARDLYPSQLQGDEPEPLELVRVPLKQIDELLNDPAFGESRHLAALYQLRDFLRQQTNQ